MIQKAMSFWRSAEWRFCLGVFLVFRFGLWGWMLLVVRLFSLDLSPDEVLHPYLGIPPERNALLEVWQRWDVLHYQLIANHSYSTTNLEPFGPLYPTLMRWGAYFTGDNTLLAGLLISSLFCLAALFAFISLARYELGTHDHAQQALLYLVFFPTAFFCLHHILSRFICLGQSCPLCACAKKKMGQSWFMGNVSCKCAPTGSFIDSPVLVGGLDGMAEFRP